MRGDFYPMLPFYAFPFGSQPRTVGLVVVQGGVRFMSRSMMPGEIKRNDDRRQKKPVTNQSCQPPIPHCSISHTCDL
jgi:hypothetical protein